MKKTHEELFGFLFGLVYPLVMGFAVAVAIYVDGMCVKSLLMLAAWLASIAVLWAMPSILRRIGKRRRVLRDERDIAIFKNASMIAHAMSWLYFLSACLVVWWRVGANGSISVNLLPLIFVGGIVVHQLTLVLGGYVQDRLGGTHG